jgi:hypothetical protein
VKVKGLVWLGTRTSNFKAMVNLYQNIMGLDDTHQEPGFVTMELPNGDRVEVFGNQSPYNTFFTNSVAGFLVDGIASAVPKWKLRTSNLSVPRRYWKMVMPGRTSARPMDSFMN